MILSACVWDVWTKMAATIKDWKKHWIAAYNKIGDMVAELDLPKLMLHKIVLQKCHFTGLQGNRVKNESSDLWVDRIKIFHRIQLLVCTWHLKIIISYSPSNDICRGSSFTRWRCCSRSTKIAPVARRVFYQGRIFIHWCISLDKCYDVLKLFNSAESMHMIFVF